MPMMPPPGVPQGAPPGQPPMGGPPQGAPPGGAPAPQGGGLDPAAIQSLARALTPENFQTWMKVMGAVMVDAYQKLQQAGQGGQPQGAAPPNGPGGMPTPAPKGAPPAPGGGGGMMGPI